MNKKTQSWFLICLVCLLFSGCAMSHASTQTQSNPVSLQPTSTAPTATLAPESGQGTLVGLTFRVEPYLLGPWPEAHGPYDPIEREYDGARDASGVRIVIRDGRPFQHPVAQAQDGLGALSIYHDTQQASWLLLAKKEAQRLIDTHTTNPATGDAWWYPYPFTFTEYGDPSDVAYAPWYSGMAQGCALDLFSDLYALTGDGEWFQAAVDTFASFLYPLQPGAPVLERPWVWQVDSDGYAWVEEYPTPNPNDDTMNGFGFALWGLIDYAHIFGDNQATLLAQAGLTTFLHGAALVRHPGGASSYSVSHLWDRPSDYHRLVTEQLKIFAAITGDAAFAEMAANFASDSP